MVVQLTGTEDKRVGKYDPEGHRIQPQEDITGKPYNPDSQGYTQFYFNREGVQYFLQVPIINPPTEIKIEFPVAAPVVVPAPESKSKKSE